MTKPSLLNADLDEVIDRATSAMVQASNEARRLAEETGTEFIARPADEVVYESEPMKSMVVREGPED